MRIHVLMHVPFEGPGAVAEWAVERGHDVSRSMAMTEEFPDPADIGMLVVMGGPMAADDEMHNPWLAAEKRLIASAIEAGCAVLGVCLGAQIVAEVIGGRVRRNEHREIGWFPLQRHPAADDGPFAEWPESLSVGLWHGDTFDLPEDVPTVLSSEACRNQAFVHLGRIVGLQFHAEWTEPDLVGLVEACAEEMVEGGPYVQPAEELLSGIHDHGLACRAALFGLLDALEASR